MGLPCIFSGFAISGNVCYTAIYGKIDLHSLFRHGDLIRDSVTMKGDSATMEFEIKPDYTIEDFDAFYRGFNEISFFTAVINVLQKSD